MDKKKIWAHIGSILFFVAITCVFFSPQFKGKELRQDDILKWQGMAKESQDYFEKTGNDVAWSGSMFSGMPNYTFSTRYNYPNALKWIEAPLTVFNNHTGAIMLSALICGYILCLVLGCSIPIAILGALAFAFSSYFPIIIAAGHVTKGWVMASMPLVIAGLLLLMREKWIVGCGLLTFALAENIRHGHIQITYYLLILCLFLFAGFCVNKIRENKKEDILRPTLAIIGCVIVAILLNVASLYSNYEMGKNSIRGESELTSKVDAKQDKSSGLDQNYAFAWSYGKAETLTFLIPNLYGGSSIGVLSKKDSQLAKETKKRGGNVSKDIKSYTYWGDQPFTSGPVYLGAVICFLFVLSLFIVDCKYKWWIVGATIFLTIMSWGRNFTFLNDFLFHNLPFYNKFRTPSMALVIPQLTFVWLACLALKTICDGKVDTQKLKKSILISAGITGGICLILWLMPSLFLSFTSAKDEQYGLQDWYLDALMADRQSILESDAFRSLLFILLTVGLLFATTMIRDKKLTPYLMAVIALLCFIDLWTVDKRYLNEDNFVKKSKEKEFVKTEADKFILRDEDPSYRVLTFRDPFNDTNVSYYHKSIGGYNAAKLRRYQDLIDLHIDPEMRLLSSGLSKNISTLSQADSVVTHTPTPILDMLNMRYLILNNDIPAATNHNANGNAWFIKEVTLVDNADKEMTALNDIDPKRQAVVDKKFANIIQPGVYDVDSADVIKLDSYEPIKMSYSYNSKAENIALFSEVYYQPGWNAYIDGKKVDHFRANWILRGLKLPAGQHNIEFRFEPNTFWNLIKFCSVASFLFIFIFIGVGVASFLKKKKEGIVATETGKDVTDLVKR